MNLLIESLLAVLYPPLCPCCEAVMTHGEGPMCLSCRIKLPLTHFEKNPTRNEMTDKLAGLVGIERAAAYFYYRRDSPQAALIHEMKYRGRPKIGQELAREYARILQQEHFFDGIDALIPVPLHFLRHCRRGFNQSAAIAAGIRDITSLPIVSALKASAHASQTRRSATGREIAAKGIYRASAKSLEGLDHVLLVDDICTTGATLHSCASAIRAAEPSLKISAVTLASTSLLS